MPLPSKSQESGLSNAFSCYDDSQHNRAFFFLPAINCCNSHPSGNFFVFLYDLKIQSMIIIDELLKKFRMHEHY